jgi:hypothetical protein
MYCPGSYRRYYPGSYRRYCLLQRPPLQPFCQTQQAAEIDKVGVLLETK